MSNTDKVKERIANIMCDRDNESGECWCNWEEAIKNEDGGTKSYYLESANQILADPDILVKSEGQNCLGKSCRWFMDKPDAICFKIGVLPDCSPELKNHYKDNWVKCEPKGGKQ